MFQKIIHFIKYHNAFTIGLALVFVFSGVLFASEDVREATIGKKVVNQEGIDNSLILSADLDNFDLNLKITAVSEDEENYYVDYTYQTLAIKDNIWQPVVREQTLTVSKVALGGKDLGLYVQEELSEVANYELSYLKEVQTIERERGLTQIVRTTDYTGLIGLTLDLKNKILPGYEPVVKPPAIKIAQITQPLIIKEPPVIEEPVIEESLIVEEPVCQPTEEICDSIDNDCDGEVDEDGVCEIVALPAGEEFPVEEKPSFEEEPPTEDVCDAAHLSLCTTQAECETASGYWYNDTCNIEPEAPVCTPSEEICDSIDNDCDGEVDEDLGQTTCGIGACVVTIDNCIGGQSQTCTPGTPTDEICDQIDNNCDGQIDEGDVCAEE